uniref:Uncharacterized protein n=1 Tax=Romanomermis culicivorax TaxID=13658 RepID=A0A915IRP5_ROMCU
MLTADQSPIDGCDKWPSESAQLRQRQLLTIIDSLQGQDLWDEDATFLAGDFNCSLNKKKFLEDQMKSNHAALTENDTLSNAPKMEAGNLNGKKIFSLNAKKFDLLDMHDWLFNTCNGQLVRKYDQEWSDLKNNGHGLVTEHQIYFPPNWPLDYDRKAGKDFYPRTQCPAWRSRILTNQKAWDMMHKNSFSGSSVYYGIIGKNMDIGEHKCLIKPNLRLS